MKRFGFLLLRGVLALVGTSLVATASAQVDPLAPLPEAPVRAATPVPPPTMVAVQPQPSFVLPAAATGFEAYKARLASLARSAGVREATIASVIPYLRVNYRVMQFDRAQPGNVGNPNFTPPFEPYRRRHVTADLIRRGQDRYAALWPWLWRVEQQTGVPASIMIAIYGHETSFGSVTGGFDIVEALATLAYEGRRRPLFEGEFVAALKLLASGIPRWRLKGSWAGATGYPQFMPSTVLRLRADGDGDGRAEIWSNQVDGLASIGNYLKEGGWRAGVPWGIAVRVPSSLDRSAVRNTATAPECPRVHARYSRPLSMREWRSMGVTPYGRSLPDHELARPFSP